MSNVAWYQQRVLITTLKQKQIKFCTLFYKVWNFHRCQIISAFIDIIKCYLELFEKYSLFRAQMGDVKNKYSSFCLISIVQILPYISSTLTCLQYFLGKKNQRTDTLFTITEVLPTLSTMCASYTLIQLNEWYFQTGHWSIARTNMFSSFNGLIQEAQDHLFQKPASVYLLCSDPYTFLSTCTQALWITPLESHHHSNSMSPSDVVYTPHLAAQSIMMAGSSRELISPGQCSSTIPRSLFICDTKIPVLSPIHQF